MDFWAVSTFWLLWIMPINIHIQVFLWTCVFISLGYITRSNIAESYGNYVKLQRNCQAVLPRIWTTLYSHQQCMRVSISPQPQQHSFSSDRFHNSYPQGYKLLFHGGFDDSWRWTSFHVVIGHLYVFFKEMSIQIICSLLKFIFVYATFKVYKMLSCLLFWISCATQCYEYDYY